MGIQFATDEWIKALMIEVNNSAAYRKAAKSWEGDFYFIVDKGEGIPNDIYMYMDLWHGECRGRIPGDKSCPEIARICHECPVIRLAAGVREKDGPHSRHDVRQAQAEGEYDEGAQNAQGGNRIGGVLHPNRYCLPGVK